MLNENLFINVLFAILFSLNVSKPSRSEVETAKKAILALNEGLELKSDTLDNGEIIFHAELNQERENGSKTLSTFDGMELRQVSYKTVYYIFNNKSNE